MICKRFLALATLVSNLGVGVGWGDQVLQAVPTLAQLELMSSPVSPECESEQTVCGKKQQQHLGLAQYSGEAKISAVREEYGRKLKHFIDRNQVH